MVLFSKYPLGDIAQQLYLPSFVKEPDVTITGAPPDGVLNITPIISVISGISTVPISCLYDVLKVNGYIVRVVHFKSLTLPNLLFNKPNGGRGH